MDKLINWIIAHKLRTGIIILIVAGTAGAMSASRAPSPLSPSPSSGGGVPAFPPVSQSVKAPTGFGSPQPSVVATHHSKSPSVQPSPSPRPLVPSLIGMTETESSQLAFASGLTIRVARWKLSSETPGTVIAQHPRAGKWAEPGETISITLSRADSAMGGGSPQA